VKLKSVPPYPSNIAANGIPTNLVWNLTPEGTFQIARVLVPGGAAENDFELLFEGSKEQCDVFLHQQIEKDFPGLMSQGS
jgi:hypothetical protein